MIQQEKLLVFDNASKSVIVNQASTDEDLKKAKAFMQTLYSDFNSR
jgi:hypothetical protein